MLGRGNEKATVLFSLGERKTVFLLHGLADGHASDSFVMAPHQLCIVLYPVVKNMQVGMFRVGMPHHYVLRVCDSYTLHIFASKAYHKSVREPWCVVFVGRNGYMTHDLSFLRPGFTLEIETADYGTDV